jgi:mono/diheme cytochrome c family protein
MGRFCLIVLVAALGACTRHPPDRAAAPVGYDGAGTTQTEAERRHGARLTHVLGCTSCHGEGLTGLNFTAGHPEYGPLYASNLTLVLPHYSDGQIERLLRAGEHPVRKSLWGMPSQLFQHLGAPDMRALILYLRTLPPSGKPTPPPQFSAQDRKDIASGEYKPAARIVAETRALGPIDLGPQYALGRYIAATTCAECHGPKLEGGPHGSPPDLIIAASYSAAQFEKLITAGVPNRPKTLNPMMAGVAKYRFSYLTPHEREALYRYLQARAQRPQ